MSYGTTHKVFFLKECYPRAFFLLIGGHKVAPVLRDDPKESFVEESQSRGTLLLIGDYKVASVKVDDLGDTLVLFY